MSTKYDRHILLWCSPGFGMIDIWLPIIHKLREQKNIKISFIFPEPSSLRLESKDSDLFNLASSFCDKVIYRGGSGRWFVADTIIEARTCNKYSKFDGIAANISSKLLKGRLSNYLFMRLIGKYILILANFFIYIKESFRKQDLYDFSLLTNADGVLCDITKEHKLVNLELRRELKSLPKFSMLHGLFASWVTSDFLCKKDEKKRKDVIVYSMSELELDGYNKCFGIAKENIVHSGIPRHDKYWIDFIRNKNDLVENKLFDSYVLIIGRPASAYNTSERKKNFLHDIYDIVCNKYNLKLVVKTHPKDDMSGVDGVIYKNALGMKNYDKNWIFSDMHPFKLGDNALFCISLFSGVSIDMLALNKPTIECLNLKDLPLYDNDRSLRDRCNNPVFQFRYTGLVYGADTRSDLEKYIDLIINKNELSTKSLHEKYKSYFNAFDNSSQFVTKNILKKISHSKK